MPKDLDTPSSIESIEKKHNIPIKKPIQETKSKGEWI